MECVEVQQPPVIERAAQTYFVNGIQRFDHVGNGMVLFAFFRNQVISDGHGAIEREVEVKILIHVADIPACMAQGAKAIATAVLFSADRPALVN